jgi:NAD(P)-dependent dehydrogenase (short-subunit alcohol dehydrogenase family)
VARVCVVTGAGPGNGAAFSRRFCAEGWRVAMLARSADALRALEREIPGAVGFPTDVTDADAVRGTFARVRAELGPVGALIHNAGSGVFAPFAETTPEQLEQAWRTNVLALLLCGREALADMQPAGAGAIVVIGATASLRGGAGTAAFASAKAAQRSLAQSMARGLGPLGIHVSYVVVDGVIDTPRTRSALRDRPDSFFLAPDRIADTVHHLVSQDRSAWSFEVDLRPFGEKW